MKAFFWQKTFCFYFENMVISRKPCLVQMLNIALSCMFFCARKIKKRSKKMEFQTRSVCRNADLKFQDRGSLKA
jgi:hypothetical protein